MRRSWQDIFETVPRRRTTLPLITGGSATGLSVIGAPGVSAAAEDGELYHRRVRPRLRGVREIGYRSKSFDESYPHEGTTRVLIDRTRCVSPSLTTSEGDWKTCAPPGPLGGASLLGACGVRLMPLTHRHQCP